MKNRSLVISSVILLACLGLSGCDSQDTTVQEPTSDTQPSEAAGDGDTESHPADAEPAADVPCDVPTGETCLDNNGGQMGQVSIRAGDPISIQFAKDVRDHVQAASPDISGTQPYNFTQYSSAADRDIRVTCTREVQLRINCVTDQGTNVYVTGRP